MLRQVLSVNLDHLREISVRAESVFNGFDVSRETIGGNLYAALEPCGQVTHKSVRGYMVALAYFERGNEFGFSVNRAECPNVAFGRIVVKGCVTLLLSDESPHFVKLDMLA